MNFTTYSFWFVVCSNCTNLIDFNALRVVESQSIGRRKRGRKRRRKKRKDKWNERNGKISFQNGRVGSGIDRRCNSRWTICTRCTRPKNYTQTLFGHASMAVTDCHQRSQRTNCKCIFRYKFHYLLSDIGLCTCIRCAEHTKWVPMFSNGFFLYHYRVEFEILVPHRKQTK